MAIKSRIFNVMQYEKHPETGETLLLEEKIKDALAHRGVKRWAYICHDKDVYSALDEEHDEKHVKGQPKPRHWHICIEMGTNQIEIGVIAKWLGIKDNYINVAKGRGAFLDIVQYLTHEGEKQQELGKRLYEDEEVKANFDFRSELRKREENKLKYGRDLDVARQMMHDVLFNGKTLAQCVEDDRIVYMDNIERLKKLRIEYISKLAPPALRLNFYVCGAGGSGKGLKCRALARCLFPEIEKDEEVFFEVGAKGSAFEGYDGQPVIIWNDRRHNDLLKELNGRGNVFNVFDTHPTRQKQNIKYSSINLCNSVNIVNSVEPFDEFLDGLCAKHKNSDGEWETEEDKSQSYRRFPFIIPIHENDFDLLLNKGFMDNTRDYTDFYSYMGIRGNMQKIAMRCGNNEKLARMLEAQTLAPVIEKVEEAKRKQLSIGEMTEEEEKAILEDFADYGSMVNTSEVASIPDDCGFIVYKGRLYKMPIETTPVDGFNYEEAAKNGDIDALMQNVISESEPYEEDDGCVPFG